MPHRLRHLCTHTAIMHNNDRLLAPIMCIYQSSKYIVCAATVGELSRNILELSDGSCIEQGKWRHSDPINRCEWRAWNFFGCGVTLDGKEIVEWTSFSVSRAFLDNRAAVLRVQRRVGWHCLDLVSATYDNPRRESGHRNHYRSHQAKVWHFAHTL